MTEHDAPYHAHIYYSEAERPAASALRDLLSARQPGILFVGPMTDRRIGPHPLPQYEVHFREQSLDSVIAAIEQSGLRALIHPLTDDDLADHTTMACWIGQPLELDLTVLDALGVNQAIARFGKTDI